MTVDNPGDLAIVPIIVGLVEVLKRLGLPTKWAPLAALALGVAGSYFFLAPGDTRQAVYLFSRQAGNPALLAKNR